MRIPELAAPPQGDELQLEWALIAGEKSVVAVDPKFIEAMGREDLRLDDGSTLTLRPFVVRARIGSDASDPTSVAARAGWWVGLSEGGRTQEWWAESLAQGVKPGESATGATVLLVETKVEGSGTTAGETTGSIGAYRVKVRWLVCTSDDARVNEVFARAVEEEAWESVWIRASMAMVETSPLTRWRSRLAGGTLLSEPGVPAARAGDPVIESLARTIEAQWAHALIRLASHDPVMARRVVERLCAAMDVGGGVFVPAWMPEGADLTALLDSLMDSRAERGVEAARAWLSNSDAVLRWVVDDAGASDAATGMPLGAVGVANLTDNPMAAWVEPPVGTGTPEILAVSPWSVRRVPATRWDAGQETGRRPAGIGAEAAARGERISLRAGDASFGPTLYPAKMPALAPGVVIGPFHADWRLNDWLVAGRDDDYSKKLGPWSKTTLVEGGWTTTGLVYRGVDTPLAEGASNPDRWLLYLEMKDGEWASGGGAGMGEVDLLRVWFGRFGRSPIVLKVLGDGRVIDESPPTGDAGGRVDVPRIVRAARRRDGWACWVPIPLSAIERDGTLRLGVERVDRRGVRTSWPRASLPWQQEPSRIGIDTTYWGERK